MRRSGWLAVLLVASAITSQTSPAAAATTALQQLQSRFQSSIASTHAAGGNGSCGADGEPLWQRVENFFGGRRFNVTAGFGKDVIGVSGGRVIESRWINFQVSMGMLVHLPFTSLKDLSWERCRAT
jgi:hypothetical protein